MSVIQLFFQNQDVTFPSLLREYIFNICTKLVHYRDFLNFEKPTQLLGVR